MKEIILEIAMHGAYIVINYFIMRASRVPGSMLGAGGGGISNTCS